jgi:hypothetical protein
LKHLQQKRTEHNADNRAFAASQREATENRRRNRVKLVEVPVWVLSE